MPNQAEINVDPKAPIIRVCKPLVRPRLVLNYCEYIKFELTTLAYLWGFSEILILLGNKQVTISLKSNLNITCRINNPL